MELEFMVLCCGSVIRLGESLLFLTYLSELEQAAALVAFENNLL
jgi:hypothetical protein